MLYSNAHDAANALLDIIEQLAEWDWTEDRIRAEFENAIEVAKDDGVLS